MVALPSLLVFSVLSAAAAAPARGFFSASAAGFFSSAARTVELLPGAAAAGFFGGAIRRTSTSAAGLPSMPVTVTSILPLAVALSAANDLLEKPTTRATANNDTPS